MKKELKKMSFEKISRLSRDEMKKIMAGSDVSCPATCSSGRCFAPYCKCDNNGSDVCDKL